MKSEILKLRQYQHDAVEKIKRELLSEPSVLLTAPCAAGKTVIFCEIVEKMVRFFKTRRVLVLLDRDILVRQTADRISAYVPDTGIFCASTGNRDTLNSVIVASRQSLAPYLAGGGVFGMVSLIIIDEAHLADLTNENTQFSRIIGYLRWFHPATRVFGCTATPYRLKTGKIYGEDKFFPKISHSITTSDLVGGGYVHSLRWKVRESDIIGKLNSCPVSSNGELSGREQFDIIGADRYIASVFDVWERHCQGHKTAVYALNIAHSELISAYFESRGIRTSIIHSRLKKEAIRTNLDDFVSGSVSVIINVGILTIGSDIPAIERIILARRTLSTALFFQIVGRGARLSPETGKTDCLIIDLCGNVLIHGHDPDNPRIGIKKAVAEDADGPRCKLCIMCDEYLPPKTKKCPICGFVFPEPEKREEREKREKKAGKLVDYDPDNLRTEIVTDFTTSQKWPGKKKGKPTVRIRFQYGKKTVSKWVAPEHGGIARKIAGRIWHEMGGEPPVPETCWEWVSRAIRELKRENRILVDFSGKWPEVVTVGKVFLGNRRQ